VVEFTIGSRGKVPGKTCEKGRRNNNNKANAITDDGKNLAHITKPYSFKKLGRKPCCP
jgi:hypothetical protein